MKRKATKSRRQRAGVCTRYRIRAARFPLSIRLAPILAAALLPIAAGATLTPKRGGTLRLAFQLELGTLDPAFAETAYDQAVQRLMFRGLFDYDDQNRLVLEQAQDWTVSGDRRTYTFHLAPGIRFPNGREVEAEDYVFSLERLLNPRTAAQGHDYYTGIRGVDEFVTGRAAHVAGLRAPDKGTLVIELSRPSFVFPFKLALPYAFPVPREIVAASEQAFRQHLAGSGPYQLKEHKPGLSWQLVRNPHYGRPDGYANEVDITIGTEPNVQTMMVERGELDFSQLSPQDLLRLKRDGYWRDFLHTLSFESVDYIFMNTERKPFDNVLMRRAVNYALNRQWLAKLVPPCAAAERIVPPSMPWANPDCSSYEHNPDKARALLRAAGYPDGFQTQLWYMQGYREPVPQAIQQQLGSIGILVQLHPVSANALFDKASTRRAIQMGFWGWIVDFPDASSFFDPPLNGAKISDTQSLNMSFYNNTEVNQLLTEADLSFDSRERQRLLQRTEAIVMQDAPWAPVLHEERVFLCDPRLQGFQSHPVWYFRLEKMWLNPQQHDESIP